MNIIRRKCIKTQGVLLTTLVLFVACVSKLRPEREALPNQYYVFFANTDYVAICSPSDDVVIPPHVNRMAIFGDVVFGERKNVDGRPEPLFFTLDTQSGERVWYNTWNDLQRATTARLTSASIELTDPRTAARNHGTRRKR